jgi:predicted DNA-binding transcriptional regulator AlpA
MEDGMGNLIRISEVKKKTTLGRAMVYLRVQQGLLPPPGKLGRCSVWMDTEIDEIAAACLARKSKDEIREIVKRLVEKRMAMA